MVSVFIPPVLRTLSGGVRHVEIDAATVRDVVESLETQFPGMKQRLCEGDMLRPGINVAIGSRICGRALHEPIPDESEVHFLPAVAGG
ncbi:MAG: MoaD/ThiS family protein [Planctomycetaceae bacterium]|nr:MoaD/ThiS family protein [Planctomycetaceae bacterium]